MLLLPQCCMADTVAASAYSGSGSCCSVLTDVRDTIIYIQFFYISYNTYKMTNNSLEIVSSSPDPISIGASFSPSAAILLRGLVVQLYRYCASDSTGRYNAPPLGRNLLRKSPTFPLYNPHVGVVGHTIDRCIMISCFSFPARILSRFYSL